MVLRDCLVRRNEVVGVGSRCRLGRGGREELVVCYSNGQGRRGGSLLATTSVRVISVA